jgi:serine phosphatase RsbU (regulator of sigma subunit)
MLVGVEWCIIFLWDEERAIFWPAKTYGIRHDVTAETPDQALLPARRYAPGEFPLLDAVRESAEFVAVDIFSDWEDSIPYGLADDLVKYLRSARKQGAAHSAKHAAHALLAIPLALKGDVLGVMLLEEAAPSGRFRQRRLEIITGIAQQAALAVQNDWLQQEMAERERLEQELQLAREIQQTFMPNRVPHLPGWEIAFLWRSARQVAGDFYDFFELPDRRLGLVIADVADKGMPAALLMTLTRTLVRAAALEDESPAAALARVNDLLVADVEHGMFVTAVYAVLGLDTGQLIYANAGHLAPLIWRTSACRLERLGKGGIALGVLEGVHVEEQRVSLEPGDHLIFYTDGISEAFSPQLEIFGPERLEAAIQVADSRSAQAMLEAIDGPVSAFVGDYPPSDDITLMVLRRSVV